MPGIGARCHELHIRDENANWRIIYRIDADGTIYIIYDHQRYTLNREGRAGVGSVVMATFREDDVRAGRPTTEQARLRRVVTQLREAEEKLP